jgi:hypothetical protein
MQLRIGLRLLAARLRSVAIGLVLLASGLRVQR